MKCFKRIESLLTQVAKPHKKRYMTENEIKNYLELGNLVIKIEAQEFNIEKGDLNFQFACLDRFPFFDGSGLVELRKDALKEYYEMLIAAFFCSCKFTYETIDSTILETIKVHPTNA